MKKYREKFTINVTDRMVVITDEKGKTLNFRPGEALMLLDILKDEESELRRMADEASPIPVRIRF